MRTLSFLRYLQGVFNLNLNSSGRVHNAVISSLYDEFIMAGGDLDAARLEMCLSTATGQWLDEWGSYFDQSRKLGESDAAFSKRIIKSVLDPKCTIPAIRGSVTDYLQDTYPEKGYTSADVLIKEPWRDVAHYSVFGALSDNAIMESDYYTHAVIDIRVPEEITKELLDLVNAVKAAGVKVIWGVYNSYEVVSGFGSIDEAWAAYHRHMQTIVPDISTTGLILSGADPYAKLSGDKEIWFEVAMHYEWMVKVHLHDTDESQTISRLDLAAFLEEYSKKEVISVPEPGQANVCSGLAGMSADAKLSGTGNMEKEVERLYKAGEDALDLLRTLDNFLTLSCSGRMSTEYGTLFEFNAACELYRDIEAALAKYKAEHPEYYESMQGAIENGERCMWYVERNKNWVWNTPLMTMDDFCRYWEPFESEEHTASSIIEFEDAYYRGYITFGDKYQPPIVRGEPRIGVAGAGQYDYLYESQTLRAGDLEAIYRAKRRRAGVSSYDDLPLWQIIEYERDYSPKQYSVIEGEQGPIERTQEMAMEVKPHKCRTHKNTVSLG